MEFGKAVKWLSAAAVAAGIGLSASAALAVKVGPVEDPIRVVKIAKGQPMTIGVFSVLSGPDVGQGLDTYRGEVLAADSMGSKLLGHPLKFMVEDDGCTAEGGQTAATKLASNQQMVVALGGQCSSATIPAAPILWKAGIPVVSPGAATPKLTAGEGTPGFSRVIFNALFEAEALAKWTRETKKLERVAAIHDGTPYVEGLATAFVDSFKKLGGTVVAVEAIGPQDVDMRPMLTRLVTTKPQMVFFPTFITATAHIVQQSREIAGFENIMLMGSDNVLDKNFVNLTGKAGVGFTIVSPPVDAETQGAGYKKLIEKYQAKHGEGPTTAWTGYGHDAFLVVAKAIEKVAVQEKGDTYIPISKLQAAIRGTKDLKGITGNVTCRPNGDCAQFRAIFYRFNNADPNTFDIGKNPAQVNP